MLLSTLTSTPHPQDNIPLQQEISKRFANNMEYFHKTSPELFDALKHNPTEYNLAINKEGINIINLMTNTPIYPIENGISQMITIHEALSQSPLKNTQWKIHSNSLQLAPMDTQKFPITGEVCNSFIDLLHKHNGIKEYFLSKDFLPSTSIFGLLGGMFLEFLRERGVFFHSLLIFEENLDMFRISCYFVDYPKLFLSVSDGACYLFVRDLVNRFFIRNFFARQKITNNFLRLELHLYESPKIDSAMQIVNEEYLSNARGWGSFEDEMIGIQNTFDNLPKKTTPNAFFHHPKRVEIPICVVGNGASLNSSLDFIKQHQDKMIIFSCGTAIAPLKHAGIEPDFHIEIERIDYLVDYLRPVLGKTPLLCGNMIHPEALNLARERYVFMRGGSASGYLFASPYVMEYCAPFVGNAGLALACQMGTEVLMCGLDCGYIIGESKHAQHSAYGEEGAITLETLPINSIAVRPNFDDDSASTRTVYSDALFLLSAQMLSQAIKTYKPNIMLNLGAGAYIDGARPTRPSEFTLKKNRKSPYIKQIKSYFTRDLRAVFHDVRSDFYLQEIVEYKEQLIVMINCEITSKSELFLWVDTIFSYCAKKSASSPYVGILFEGTLAHICQHLMIAILHLPSNDIKAFFEDAKTPIINALEKMVLRYKMLISRY